MNTKKLCFFCPLKILIFLNFLNPFKKKSVSWVVATHYETEYLLIEQYYKGNLIYNILAINTNSKRSVGNFRPSTFLLLRKRHLGEKAFKVNEEVYEKIKKYVNRK